MRTPPNALNVFGTTGAIGTARTAGSIALAELNRNRLARGIAPAAARPSAKNLRVESPPIETSIPQEAPARGRMRRLAGAVWAQEWCQLARFALAHSRASIGPSLSEVTAWSAADVRIGSKADIEAPPRDVRFTPKRGDGSARL